MQSPRPSDLSLGYHVRICDYLPNSDPLYTLDWASADPQSAQWLRDTGNQFAHLYKLLPHDKNLQALVKAVINTEARYISQYPYCGGFELRWYIANT